ncbi:hypothetical protein A3K72_03580 [Candidatus Woesearchaeota archaeon RBG_13_36_6]|nr:MAG: hypothetical protein A3K72_03580 [Candidatus Woesearchaeota archaeon RBG_13_36_6]
MDTILVRYSEIGLKGKNRTYFENKLVNNIRECMKKNKVRFSNLHKSRGRILLYSLPKAATYLKNVFGIASLSIAKEVELNHKAIEKAVEEASRKERFKTFRISVQRLNKNFQKTSMQLEAELGAFVVKRFRKKVKLENPDLNIHIEITDKAYIFTETVFGFRGLPISTQGKVISLIEDKESLLSTILVMRRGCSAVLVGFKDFDIEPVKRFAYGFEVKFIKLKKFEDIEDIAKRNKIKALVVGQTTETIKNLETDLLLLRPLVGYSKLELIQLYKQFGIK